MDASGQVTPPPGSVWTRTITQAAGLAVAGDTILVQGLVEPVSNQPLGYSEQSWYPLSGEMFPIALAAGVQLRPADSTRVYVWSITGAVALFDLQGSAALSLTKLEGASLLGGATAVRAHHSGGANGQVLLKDLRLSGNTIGVSAIASGANLQISVRDSLISDQLVTTPMIPPPYLAPAIGLRFQAMDQSGPGNVKAEVVEFTCSGQFASMSSLPLNGVDDLGVSTASRILDVRAEGGLSEHALPQLRDISDVELIVQGGVLDGAASTGGWDLGLYAYSKSTAVPDPVDYTAGYRATFTGTQVRNTRLAGLVAVSNIYARGRLEINGLTEVTGVGSHTTHSPGDPQHSGVHLFARESYLAFISNNALLRNNTGHGVWANCPDEQFVPHGLPQGILVGMYRSASHENDGSGVAMNVGSGTFSGVVGGTSHVTEDGESAYRHLFDDGENFLSNVGVSGVAPLEFGQGAITRCAISNNGESGVHVASTGTYEPERTHDPDSVVNFRLSNSFLWNNPSTGSGSLHGGLTVRLEPMPGEQDRGLCLLPVTHCTFVNNGGTAGWNAEFEDGSTMALPRGRYEWSVPHDPILRTRVYDSIFYRDIPVFLALDFGGNLEEIGKYETSSMAVNVRQIGVAALRTKSGIFNLHLDQRSSASLPVPFVNPNPVLTSLLPDMFFLNPGAINIADFRDWTAPYLYCPVPECTEDYQGQSRPPVTSGLRDKGPDEL